MDESLDRVSKAMHAYRRAERRTEDTRTLLHAAIIDALRAGARQVDIVRLTGYTRERIRQISKGTLDDE